MLNTSKGIVLNQIKYSEKSVIAKVYTDLFGLQSFLIHGVRSNTSKNKAVYLQPLSLVELTFNYKSKGGLQTIKNINLLKPYKSIPFNIIKTSIAFFLAEVLYKTIREEEVNEKLFNFLFNTFQIFDIEINNYANFHLIFLGQLCGFIGIQPQESEVNSSFFFDLQEGCFVSIKPTHNAFISPPISNHLKTILNTSFTNNNLTLSNIDRKVLLKVFLDYYHLHLSNFDNLKSLSVLEEVLN